MFVRDGVVWEARKSAVVIVVGVVRRLGRVLTRLVDSLNFDSSSVLRLRMLLLRAIVPRSRAISHVAAVVVHVGRIGGVDISRAATKASRSRAVATLCVLQLGRALTSVTSGRRQGSSWGWALDPELRKEGVVVTDVSRVIRSLSL